MYIIQMFNTWRASFSRGKPLKKKNFRNDTSLIFKSPFNTNCVQYAESGLSSMTCCRYEWWSCGMNGPAKEYNGSKKVSIGHPNGPRVHEYAQQSHINLTPVNQSVQQNKPQGSRLTLRSLVYIRMVKWDIWAVWKLHVTKPINAEISPDRQIHSGVPQVNATTTKELYRLAYYKQLLPMT